MPLRVNRIIIPTKYKYLITQLQNKVILALCTKTVKSELFTTACKNKHYSSTSLLLLYPSLKLCEMNYFRCFKKLYIWFILFVITYLNIMVIERENKIQPHISIII